MQARLDWLAVSVQEVDDKGDAAGDFLPEIVRVAAVISSDEAWAAWSTSNSRAPALDLRLALVRPRSSAVSRHALDHALGQTGVRKGRKQHHVLLHVDPTPLADLAGDERRQLACPTLQDALQECRRVLGLPVMPAWPQVTDPPELSAATGRRRRLQELRRKGATV